jgi:membrane protein implicated in regulation of membrane protease activity
MTTIYWYCLGGGFAFTLLLFVIGDLLEGALDALDGVLDAIDIGDALDPMSLVGGVTVFGGAGLLLSTYAELATAPEIAIAASIAVLISLVLHFAYVKPMKRSENSTAFSHAEYVGKTGEIGTTVPAAGFGEVYVRMGASTTFQTASSFDGTEIPAGTAVVVVEAGQDGTLRVAPLGTDDVAISDAAVAPRARLQTH